MATWLEPIVYRPARWSLDVTVAPTVEPVTLAEVKRHLRVDHNDDDLEIERALVAARGVVETMTRRALMTQTRVLRIDDFPPSDDMVIELPGGNVQSVTSVVYQDETNAEQTWSAANYIADLGTTGGTGRIGTAYNVSWPGTVQHGLPVTITYVAGWSTAASVPMALRSAMMMVAHDLFHTRSSMRMDDYSPNPAVAMLTRPWVVQRVA